MSAQSHQRTGAGGSVCFLLPGLEGGRLLATIPEKRASQLTKGNWNS